MRQKFQNMNKFISGILLLSWILAGCSSGGSSSVRFYLVDPVELSEVRSGSEKPLKIEIINLHIPEYLERSHIATRSGESRLQFSEFNQWGENLRKNLMRTMARNLSNLLSTADISTPLSRSSSMPDYRLEIHIDQFEQDSEGLVKLSARWQLINTIESGPLGIHSADLVSPYRIAERDYDQMVSEMRDLYGQLSKMIAENIIMEEER